MAKCKALTGSAMKGLKIRHRIFVSLSMNCKTRLFLKEHIHFGHVSNKLRPSSYVVSLV